MAKNSTGRAPWSVALRSSAVITPTVELHRTNGMSKAPHTGPAHVDPVQSPALLVSGFGFEKDAISHFEKEKNGGEKVVGAEALGSKIARVAFEEEDGK